MRRKAAAVILAIAAALMMSWYADWYLSIPVVDRSMTTQRCVRVSYPEHRYTCQTVPDWPTLTRWVP